MFVDTFLISAVIEAKVATYTYIKDLTESKVIYKSEWSNVYT